MNNRITRRGALRLVGAGGAAMAGGIMHGDGKTGSVLAADDFDALRARWRDLIGASGDPADTSVARALAALDTRVLGYRERMDTAPNRTRLWPDLGPGTSDSSYLTDSYNRLTLMARAFVTPGSKAASDTALLAQIIGGLDFLYEREYNETKTIRGNWWDWEIGTPLALNNATTLLYDRLSPAQITNYMNAVHTFTPVADIFYGGKNVSTGANRVWKAEVVAVRAVLVRDGAKLAHARDSLADVFPYVTSGDGFYADGSFIQHGKHPYTGGYGLSLMQELAKILALLGGSPYAVTNPGVGNVYRAVSDSFQPVIYNGAFMDSVRGREISRATSQDHIVGHAAIRAILLLAESAPPADAAMFRAMAKGWIRRDTYRDYLVNAPLEAIPAAQRLLTDAAIPAAPELVGHWSYAAMDRVIHRRPGFAVALGISSERVYTYESINRENLRAWYTGDGFLQVYTPNDLAQFADDFWATANPYRLPGTTVDTRPRTDSDGQSKAPDTQWTGGVALGEFGAAGMELKAFGSSLTAKKSWFFLDDAIVCLGAGITSSDGRPVETIIEQRKLNDAGDNTLTVDGSAKPSMLGYSETLVEPVWLHLAGAGGYVIGTGETVRVLRDAHTGRWNDINKSSTAPPVTRNYLALWLDHGANPRDATYAYTLLPTATPEATAAYAANPDSRVVANDANGQAIASTRLALLAANFWGAGTVTDQGAGAVGFIAADAPASVLVRREGDMLTVAVSDPTQKGTRIRLEIGRACTGVRQADSRIRLALDAPVTILDVDVAGAAGRTLVATLALP